MAMVHHRALKRWLQPGGHLDSGELPHEAAVRECFEETGLTISLVDDQVPDAIDLHRIPANPVKGEAEHYHLDFKYVAVASGRLRPELTEVASARWLDPDPALLRDERVIAAINAMRVS